MTDIHSARRASKRLLLTSAGAVLTTMLANSPASAQTFQDARAEASRALVNRQTASAATTADAHDTAQTVTSGTIRSSSAAVSDTTTAATARANNMQQSLSLDPSELDAGVADSRLIAGDDHASARASVAAVNLQILRRAPVVATTDAARTAVQVGDTRDSKLAVTGNAQDAAAFGNEAVSGVTLSGVSTDGGAGIVSAQHSDAASSVSAYSRGRQILSAETIDESALTMSGNTVRATGVGNTIDSSLDARLVDISVPGSDRLASIVLTAGGESVTNAAFGVLANQSVGADVVTQAGDQATAPVFKIFGAGNVDGSSVALTGNTLAADAFGNRSENRVALDATTIGPSTHGAPGPVATVANVQRLAAAHVLATTAGGSDLSVNGSLNRASLDISGNAVRTAATGNLANGNLLSVKASEIGTSDRQPETSNWGKGPGLPPIGTARVDARGNGATSADLSVQNVQDYGAGDVSARQAHPYVIASVKGAIRDSSVSLTDNLAVAAATGNDAINGLSIDAGSLRSTAGINNVQRGTGDVTTSIAATTARSKTIIAPGETVIGSHLAIERNVSNAAAIANVAANDINASANAIANDSDRDAVAGPTADGYGTAATLSLANSQTLGRLVGEDRGTTQVSSSVTGRFGVTGDDAVDHTSISVKDNAQRAAAAGNTAANTLKVSARTIDGYPAAGMESSSTQLGQADVHADSTMNLAAKGELVASQATIAGNSNRSFAIMNDANNSLAVSATEAAALTGTLATGTSAAYGPPRAVGDAALANQQFASGSTSAASDTLLVNPDGRRGLDGSTLTIRDNLTRADATANQAVNTLDTVAITGDPRSAVLVSTQTNVGGVQASARTTGADAVYPGRDPSVRESAVTLDGNVTAALARGNAADNRVSLGGASAPLSTSAASADRYGASASAQAAVLNNQMNFGSVTAVGYSAPAPLNGIDAPVSRSILNVSGNVASATAFGNVATNTATVSGLGRLPTAALSNVQSNAGPVFAQVTGGTFGIRSGTLVDGALTVNGNQLVAAATGNQASNVIAGIR